MTIQTLKIQHVVDTIKAWSPTEQLELIQAITKLLEDAYDSGNRNPLQTFNMPDTTVESIHHSPPIVDLNSLVADFWPQDESADEINSFVYQQRQQDMQNEL